MKKSLSLAASLALLFVIPLADAKPPPGECLAQNDVYCDTECSSTSWGLACFDESTRCCFESANACGDMHAADCGPFCCSGLGGF